MKKIIAIIMALVMLFAFASCGSSADDQRSEINEKLDAISEKLEEVVVAMENGSSSGTKEEPASEAPTEVVEEVVTDANGEAVTNAKGEKVTVKVTKAATTKKGATTKPGATIKAGDGTISADPSTWTKQQIVDYYRYAAFYTSQKKGQSSQSMKLAEKLPGAYSIISGAVDTALKSGSKPFEGITGGYVNLVPDDLSSIKATKSGNYIYITLLAKEQVDGAYGKAREGHTGHLVSVLDGIAVAVDAMGVSAEYPEGSVKLTYKNGYAKNIKINTANQIIESGSWGYDLNMDLNGCKISILPINNFHGVIEYRVKYPA